MPDASGWFGDNDAKMSMNYTKDVATISSRIASVTIGGQVLGTVGGADHFGIVAENVGAMTIGDTRLVLASGNSNDDFTIGITGDMRIHEIY